MNISDIIIELSEIAGPSGFERGIADAARSYLGHYMDDVHTDVMGNVIGVKKCGRENAKKLMIDAHIDEIGFVITGYEEGLLRFASLGSTDIRMLPASEIKILTKPPIIGVVDVLPPHTMKDGEADKALDKDELFIDIGLDQENAKKTVPLGTAAVYNAHARRFGDNLICGKALDDRACFAAVLRAVELLKDETLDVDLYIMASAQEELGMRGAKTGAFSVMPDWCVVVDVDHAQTPDSKSQAKLKLGGGVAIARGPNMNRALTEKAIDIAEKNKLKYQITVEYSGNSGTNTHAIQAAGAGVATALFSLPLRYMHSPVEVISTDDAETVAALLYELAKSFEGVE